MGRAVSDSIITTLAFLLQRSLGLVRELIIAGILGPTYMGLRNALLLVYNYSPYAFLGMDNELFRRVAYLHTRYEKETAHVFNTVLTWGLITSLIIAIGIAAFAYTSNYSDEFKLGLYILAPLVVLMIVGVVVNLYLNAIGRFKFNAAVETVSVILNTIFTIYLAMQFGFVGAIAGLLIAILARFVIYWNEMLKYKPALELEIKRFIDLFANGIRLFVTSVASTIYSQVDSVVAVIMLGPAALGIYGIATTLNQLVYGTYNSTVIPVSQRMFKSADNPDQLKRYLDILSGLSSYLMVFPIIAIVLISPYIIDTYIPAFHDAIAVIGVLAAASFFNVTLQPVGNYLIAKRKENLITISTLIAAAVNLVLDIYLIQQGYGLIGVAYATSFSYLLNFAILIAISGALEPTKVVEDLVPLAYLLLFLFTMQFGWELPAVLTLAFIPVTYFVFEKRGIATYIKTVIKETFARKLKSRL